MLKLFPQPYNINLIDSNVKKLTTFLKKKLKFQKTIKKKARIKIIRSLANNISYAMQQSSTTHQFISYTLQSNLQILVKKNNPHMVNNEIAYLDCAKGQLFFNYKRIKDLSPSIISHEFWHGFWFTLQNKDHNNKANCDTGKQLSGFPFTPVSTLKIESYRKLVFAVYKDLENIWNLLETFYLDKNSHKKADQITNNIIDTFKANPHKPKSIMIQCTQKAYRNRRKGSERFKIQSNSGHQFTISLDTQKSSPPQCFGYLTCNEIDTAICQAINAIVYPIKRCFYDLQANSNSYLNKPFKKQLSVDGKKVYQMLIEQKININVANHKLANALGKIDMSYLSKLGLDNTQLTEGLLNIQTQTTLMISTITECDATLTEQLQLMPLLLNLTSYQKLAQRYQQEVQKWLPNGDCTTKNYRRVNKRELLAIPYNQVDFFNQSPLLPNNKASNLFLTTPETMLILLGIGTMMITLLIFIKKCYHRLSSNNKQATWCSLVNNSNSKFSHKRADIENKAHLDNNSQNTIVDTNITC